jgi:hypothetical protein
VRIGVSFWPGWWGHPFYPYGPSYPYYPYYPYYPVVQLIPQLTSDIYVDEPAPPAEEILYLYYCPDPEGYYPQVGRCPKGWLKVVAPDNPPE